MNSNYDLAELAKFTDLAHDWWNEDSASFGALHKINPLRLGWINDIAPLKDKRVLDVGAGGGILADSMARAGAEVLGIDLGAQSLQIAKLHALEARTPNIQYETISAEELAEKRPASFDVVTCMEMLEHVPDPAAIVQACARLVNPKGWVFFSTINRNPKAFASAIVAGEYLLGLLPRGTHEYAKFIQPAELMRWVRNNGLAPKAMQGLTYNPITQRYALTADASVNYMIATQKI
ncbi:MAG: bifunctional 2-polyprenyl-6-hydroxyphenol methylase/3-demethylubiquinol 3-O-methyltransferase UbiG [Cytophagales bacterium]|nr:bifunctional 2-polyprenyl-6-hydroxyphenol methylase/3-demethylubiquinol 3-O-methyltransferase UbiG [Cytophagales bacterium]